MHHHPSMITRLRPAPAVVAIVVALVLVACSGSTGTPADSAEPLPTETASMVAESLPPNASAAPSVAPSPDASPQPAAVLAQPWATAPLTDVATGETFRIADLAGKVVIVETMAIWCSNCRAQQGDVVSALERLPADDVVYVVLDVDPNEDAASLADYRVDNGFEGRYAIAGSEVARALAAEFGDQFLNPPSTPMLIIGTDGTVTRTEFGHKSPDQIVALAEAHGA
jgi:thiol-disulfide isomerase/thioredoxin